FGADPAVTGHLLQLARQLGLDVVGVSFHVGSGATDARAFADAVARARAVFDEAAALGFSPHLLDVGGGFPGDDPAATPAAAVRFEDIARELRSAFAEHFPPSAVPGLRIIAEPGWYYVASASSLAVCITSKRRVVDVTATTPTATTGATPTTPASNATPHPATEPPPKFMYYVNDGVYQSFNCIIFDHARVQAQVLYTGNGVPAMDDEHLAAAVLHESSVWGPTCDSIDCVQASTMLPELDVGDWLVFDNMGAYTSCAASTFNGFALTKHVYTFSHVLVDLQRVPAADGIAHVPAALPLAAGFAVAPSAATTPAVTATLGAATAAIARAPKPVGHAVPIPTPVS
ncbi:ornithine decarboxylase, partial [Salpingoeca rosetta]